MSLSTGSAIFLISSGELSVWVSFSILAINLLSWSVVKDSLVLSRHLNRFLSSGLVFSSPPVLSWAEISAGINPLVNSWTQTFFSASLAIRSEILGSSAELTKKLSILELTSSDNFSLYSWGVSAASIISQNVSVEHSFPSWSAIVSEVGILILRSVLFPVAHSESCPVFGSV